MILSILEEFRYVSFLEWYTFLEHFMTLCIFLLADNLSSRIGLLISHTTWGCRWFSKHCQGFQKTSFQNIVKVSKKTYFQNIANVFKRIVLIFFKVFEHLSERNFILRKLLQSIITVYKIFCNFDFYTIRFWSYIKIRFHILPFFCSQYFARNIAWTGMLAGVSDLVVRFSKKW